MSGSKSSQRRSSACSPRNRRAPGSVSTAVNGSWLDDIESLEAISQDDVTRNLFLRMAQMSQCGRIQPFLRELAQDRELDADTKSTLAELAQDATFLHAVEDYVLRTRELH